MIRKVGCPGLSGSMLVLTCVGAVPKKVEEDDTVLLRP